MQLNIVFSNVQYYYILGLNNISQESPTSQLDSATN